MGGGDGQRQVAHQIVGTAIGGGGGGDRAVHQVLIHEFVLWRCSSGNLRFDSVDVAGVLLFSSLGAGFLCIDITLKGDVTLLTGILLVVDGILESTFGGLRATLLIVNQSVHLGLGVGGGLWSRQRTGLCAATDGGKIVDDGLLTSKQGGKFGIRWKG